MRLDRLRTFALGLPHVTVAAQWGGEVFKVAGKVFMVVSLDGAVVEGVAFKCTPAEFDELTAIDGIVQAPYFAKRQWACIEDLAALPEAALNARLRRSFALVAAGLPKKVQAGLGLAAALTAAGVPRVAGRQ